MNSAQNPAPDSAGLLTALDLVEESGDVFVAAHQVIPSGRAYGGEVVGQAVTAMMRTVDADRTIHSFHGYFLRAGVLSDPSSFAVQRLRDGRGFSARRVTATQLGKVIFEGLASFHVDASGVEHHDVMPAGLQDPESLPTSADVLRGSTARDARYWSYERNFDIRHEMAPVYLDVRGERLRHQVVWVKSYQPLPDDPNVHRAALAYLCDYTLLEPVLRFHGAAWAQAGVVTASLDHAMWWHADGRVDDWVALVQSTPSAEKGLALTTASIFARDGRLLASVSQQGLVQLP